MQPVTFELLHEIEFPGNPIEHLFFIEEGMASMTTTFADGSQVEVGMFGYESVIGVSALMGTKRSLNRVYTQIAGHGYSCEVKVAGDEFRRGGAFQNLALRYVQAQLLHATQSAGCNAKHNVEQRLARWLLHCVDRLNSDTYAMSQDALAEMLGSTRPTLSLAAGLLRDEGLIAYSRGVIRILDVRGLEKRACECYRIVKDYLDHYAELDSGTTALPESLRSSLHGAKISEQPRTACLPLLNTPALFVDGSRDAVGTLQEMKEAVKVIPRRKRCECPSKVHDKSYCLQLGMLTTTCFARLPHDFLTTHLIVHHLKSTFP